MYGAHVEANELAETGTTRASSPRLDYPLPAPSTLQIPQGSESPPHPPNPTPGGGRAPVVSAKIRMANRALSLL